MQTEFSLLSRRGFWRTARRRLSVVCNRFESRPIRCVRPQTAIGTDTRELSMVIENVKTVLPKIGQRNTFRHRIFEIDDPLASHTQQVVVPLVVQVGTGGRAGWYTFPGRSNRTNVSCMGYPVMCQTPPWHTRISERGADLLSDARCDRQSCRRSPGAERSPVARVRAVSAAVPPCGVESNGSISLTPDGNKYHSHLNVNWKEYPQQTFSEHWRLSF
jgi:hypothetical protein